MVVDESRIRWTNREVLSGIALIVTGFVLLTIEWQDWPLRWGTSWWAMLLFVLGVIRLVEPGEADGRRRSRRGSVWLLGLGVWGMVSESRLLGLNYFTSWPLLVVTEGVNMLWRALEAPSPPAKTAAGDRHD